MQNNGPLNKNITFYILITELNENVVTLFIITFFMFTYAVLLQHLQILIHVQFYVN